MERRKQRWKEGESSVVTEDIQMLLPLPQRKQHRGWFARSYVPHGGTVHSEGFKGMSVTVRYNSPFLRSFVYTRRKQPRNDDVVGHAMFGEDPEKQSLCDRQRRIRVRRHLTEQLSNKVTSLCSTSIYGSLMHSEGPFHFLFPMHRICNEIYYYNDYLHHPQIYNDGYNTKACFFPELDLESQS